MTSTPPTEPRPETPLAALGRTLAELDETKETLTKAMSAINTERQTRFRWRFTMAVLIPLTVLILIGTIFNYQAAHEARDVGRTLNDCLVIGGECYTRLAKDGTSGLVRQMLYQECFSVVEPTKRTHELFTGCREKALAPILEEGKKEAEKK